MNKKFLEMVVVKLFKVIDSMTSIRHIDGVRKYIDLYYQQFGEKNKQVIEIYFKTRMKLLK